MKFLVLMISSLPLSGYAQQQKKDLPAIFLPGIVSTGYNERDMAISPDGKEMFYTIQSPRLSLSVIVRRVLTHNNWGEAELASFSGEFADLEPAFSADGKKIFFVSNRPLTPGGKIKDYDIWYAEKTPAGWGKAVNAGPAVNSSENEFYPSLTVDGSLYFTAVRADTLGQEDIYKSQWLNNQFQQPQNIGAGVNSTLDEFNAFIDPLERYIIFSVEGGGEGYIGRGDLCISYRNPDGSWTKAKNAGTTVNSSRLDYCPFVRNGIFYFTSERIVQAYQPGKKLSFKQVKNILDAPGNGFGDIYYMPLDKIIELK